VVAASAHESRVPESPPTPHGTKAVSPSPVDIKTHLSGACVAYGHVQQHAARAAGAKHVEHCVKVSDAPAPNNRVYSGVRVASVARRGTCTDEHAAAVVARAMHYNFTVFVYATTKRQYGHHQYCILGFVKLFSSEEQLLITSLIISLFLVPSETFLGYDDIIQ